MTRHGTEEDLRKTAETAITAFGKLTRPKGLRGHALAAWKSYIEPASWLDGSREPAAIAFCELWAEFKRMPATFPASKMGQMRALMSDIGLTDERNRAEDPSKNRDEFFDDE